MKRLSAGGGMAIIPRQLTASMAMPARATAGRPRLARRTLRKKRRKKTGATQASIGTARRPEEKMSRSRPSANHSQVRRSAKG
jgi:hypothetical protein